MKLAILHYHLKPGGVTTVIRNAAQALSKNIEVNIVADLGYNETPAPSRALFLRDARALAAQLRKRLDTVDVLHTHNVGLGKHPRLTCAIKLLAQTTDLAILNQVHDFPEDNRPAPLRALRTCAGKPDTAFYRSLCYYDLPNVRWATLTTGDAAKLTECGVPEHKIDVLPNPIDDLFFAKPAPREQAMQALRDHLARYARAHRYAYNPARRLILCPMKVMERKNNAEAVELVRRLGNRYQLLITLDASGVRDKKYAAQLKRTIRRNHLPVVIGFGLELDDPLPLFHLAHAIVTTSTVEGFGYTFVEGWLCDKLVVGRNIERVTRDFIAAGMDLRHLYDHFDDHAVRQTARLLDNPPRRLIAHNHRVVMKQYSLQAYARRFARIVRSLRHATEVIPHDS